MLKEYKMQAVMGVWGGLLFFLLGYLVSSAPQQSYIFFGRTIMLGGYVLFICGCFMYARGKGRNWYWGIFSVLGPVGLLFLYCLKDNSKMVSKKRQKELS